MERSQSKRREDLAGVAAMVESIERQQKDHPGYAQGVIESIVGHELRVLERESGVSLDEVAEDWPYYQR
jgi:hypothetical protein